MERLGAPPSHFLFPDGPVGQLTEGAGRDRAPEVPGAGQQADGHQQPSDPATGSTAPQRALEDRQDDHQAGEHRIT